MLIRSKRYSPQPGMFSGLADQLNQKHPLYLLSQEIDWYVFFSRIDSKGSIRINKPPDDGSVAVVSLERLMGKEATEIFADRGYKGMAGVQGQHTLAAHLYFFTLIFVKNQTRLFEGDDYLSLCERVNIKAIATDGNHWISYYSNNNIISKRSAKCQFSKKKGYNH